MTYQYNRWYNVLIINPVKNDHTIYGALIMTDKEFKKLRRSELIAIIYEYQKKQDALEQELSDVKKRLGSKELKISNAGSIAEAVVALSGLFETAQKTADSYVKQVRINTAEAEKKAAEIIEEAQKKADEIIENAKKASEDK